MNSTNPSANSNHAGREPNGGDHPVFSEVEWRAFCYLADELSPSERQAFEQLLESDPAAQHAMVAQMELAEQVDAMLAVAGPQGALAAKQPPVLSASSAANNPPAARGIFSPRRTGQRIPYSWLSAVAILLLIGVGWLGWDRWQARSEFQLADEWARQLSTEIAQATPLDEDGGPDNDSLEWETGELETETEHGDESWIFAAAMALDDEDFDWLQGT